MTRDWPFVLTLLSALGVLTGAAYIDLRTFGLVLVALWVGFLAGTLFAVWLSHRSESSDVDYGEDDPT